MSTGWDALVIALWISVVALAAIILALVRRLDALTADEVAPHEVTATGRPRVGSSMSEFSGYPAADGFVRLYLFLGRGCYPCHLLIQGLQQVDWSPIMDRGIETIVIADLGLELGTLEDLSVVIVDGVERLTAYGVSTSPFIMLVDGAGEVRGATVPRGFEDILAMVGVPMVPRVIGKVTQL